MSDDDYEILIAAASRVNGLPELLANRRLSVTLFAPTNEAFIQFLADNNFDSLEDVPNDLLAAVLGNHLLFRPKTANLLQSYENTLTAVSFGGGNFELFSLYVNKDNGVTLNGNVNVIDANNIINRRSVVHKVDKVIAFPDLLTFATSNPAFSSLVAALTRPDLSVDFVGALSGEGPFTVLAPTNDAFEDLLDALGLSSLNQIPASTLEQVLLYHVAEGNFDAKRLSRGKTVETLSGETYHTGLRFHRLVINANQNSAKVLVKDVQGINGVIHAIDSVILP